MNNNAIKPDTSGVIINTTKRCEWWGWLGSMIWLFFMMYGYDVFMFPELAYDEGSWHPFFFMVFFAMAIMVFGFHFSKNPNRLASVAFYTTPVAIAITAVFAILPSSLGSVLYIVSPVFMAPLLTRRVFGVIHTARSGKQLTIYMSAITICVVFFALWITVKPSKDVAFFIPTFFIIPAWFGIRRTIEIPDESPSVCVTTFSKRLLFVLVSVVILLFWLSYMNSTIYTSIVASGIKTSNIPITLLSFSFPVISFLLYGIISDKGYERAGFISGMMIFIFGIFIALLPSGQQAPRLIPLIITNSLGGSYFEFLILTFPIHFLNITKRPVFTASLGVVANLVNSALLYISGFWMPEPFLTFGTPVLFASAISVIGCTVLVFFLFERYKEKTLVAALYVLLHDSRNAHGVLADDVTVAEPSEKQGMVTAVLTQEEVEFALLLIEGKTRSEITRKLHLKAAEANDLMNSIRNKISGIGDPDPVITTIALKYNLTGREIDMLRFLRKGMTNSQIAVELVISEATVKNHVSNLMKKLPVSRRQEISPWLETVDIIVE